MNRLCLMIACLSAVAWTQASAESLSFDPPKTTPRPHATKTKHPATVSKAENLNSEIRFSDPYAPPEGTTIVKKSGLPGYSYPVPKDPQGGGLSISMGKDSGGHTNGGLSWGI
jgi:hypothetical protein